jgi:Alkaline and neutral invertase
MYTVPAISTNLIDECCQHSLDLLRHNSVDAGILAASPGSQAAGRNYTGIFGRDAALCALGMAASGIPDMVAVGRAGLKTLSRHQADNGQIPKFVRPQNGESDFWYTGCIDATLWWLIAVRLFDRLVPGAALEEELSQPVRNALQWLNCQEHPVWRLVQQNEASDWADIMPRSGFVLYSNALWYWVKRLYRLPDADVTAQFARQLLSPFDGPAPQHPRIALMADHILEESSPTPFFLSFVNFSFWGEEIDVFGNLLAALTGLADPEKSGKISEELLRLGVNRPHPIRVVGAPIEPDHQLWRRYMERHQLNLPYQYHNGGIWPFVGCFWVLLLDRNGLREEARLELDRLAALNRVNGWEFNEWFHGRTGQPMGMPGQSWNAALFLLAAAALERDLPLF